MRKVEVVLVDKNPVINFLAADFENLNEIVWLYENCTLRYLNNVENLLKSTHRIDFTRTKLPTKDWSQFATIIKQIKEKYSEEFIILNLSGANQVAGYLLFDGLQEIVDEIFIIDSNKNSIVDIKNRKSDIIHSNLTVNEYIRLYGMRVRSGIHFDPKIGARSRLSYFIGNNIEIVVPFLDQIRETVTRKDVKEDEWRLNKRGVNFNIKKDHKFYTVHYGNNGKDNETQLDNIAEEYLFRGEWLRELVFLRVNKSHFGDVRLNIKLDPDSVPQNTKIETIIDVAMRRRCKFYIFQCFSYPISKNSFIALNSISRTIEELNAESFILLSHRPPNNFIARAHSFGIKIVYGDKIANFSI